MQRCLVGGAVIVVIGAIVVAWTGGDAAQSETTDGSRPVRFEVYADASGVRMGLEQQYPDDRDLTGGEVTIGAKSDKALTFWSSKYDDTYPPPDPFPVAATTRVVIEKTVIPDCSDPGEIPVLTVDYQTSDGKVHSDSYRPTDLDEYLAAVETYCGLGAEVQVTGSAQYPDGAFTVTLQITNPTRTSVRVVSEALQKGDTTWQPASTNVPPQGISELVLRGHGQGCSDTNPWTTGHLTINGAVPGMDESQSEQC